MICILIFKLFTLSETEYDGKIIMNGKLGCAVVYVFKVLTYLWI
jgi:hypothetical protein